MRLADTLKHSEAVIAVASQDAKVEVELDGHRYPVHLEYGVLVFDGKAGPETAPTWGVYHEVKPVGAPSTNSEAG